MNGRFLMALLLNAAFIYPLKALGEVDPSHVVPNYETIVETEDVEAGGQFTVFLRNVFFLCPYVTGPADPLWAVSGGNIDVFISISELQFTAPGCTNEGPRYTIPAPRNPGTYTVRVYFLWGVIEHTPTTPRSLQAKSNIEVLPPLPIPATHLWAQGLMALSLLAIGTVFARLRARA